MTDHDDAPVVDDDETAEREALNKRIILRLGENERKANKLMETYNVGLNPLSAFHHRLVMLIKQIKPDLDPEVPLPLALEYLIERVLGPMNENAPLERLRYEMQWQESIAASLEDAHAEAAKMKREASGLILPNGSDHKGLHLP